MRVLSKRVGARDESGAVLIWMALMMTVLLGMGAFAVDLGLAWSVKRQLSVSADGAALAGAQEAGMRYKELGSCLQVEALAEQTVEQYFDDNPPQGENVTVTADADACSDSQRVTVDVEVSSDLGTIFGGVLNVDTMTPGAAATAQVFGTRILSGLRPFTVCLSDAQDAAASGGTHQSVYKNFGDDPDQSCNPTGAAGNWGYASFGLGTSNTNLLCLIENGYGPACGASDSGVDVGAPADFETSPGYTGNNLQNNPNHRAALNSIVGETILLPVAGDTSWSDTGSGATYGGAGAVAVEICGWELPPGDAGGEKSDCWDQTLYDNAYSAGGWDKNADAPSLVIQWQYRDDWVTSTTGQDPEYGGDLGDALTIAALRLVK